MTTVKSVSGSAKDFGAKSEATALPSTPAKVEAHTSAASDVAKAGYKAAYDKRVALQEKVKEAKIAEGAAVDALEKVVGKKFRLDGNIVTVVHQKDGPSFLRGYNEGNELPSI